MVKSKKWMVIFMMFFLMVPSVSLAGSIKDGSSGEPGEWYVGDIPSNGSSSKHPILFVHGLNSSSETWYENNDMYETAYQNGYETAFIDLHPGKDMWENGALLKQKIKEIYQHFGKKIVVVAHSKGGIDTQSALIHYEADPFVERVITLSTPHYGSELADLAYSSWASWLAGTLGSKNDATHSLQTGYMDYFRSVTDQHENVLHTPIFTFGGTEWGSFGSSLYWGGLYLQPYGSNDGAVTVNSSRLPYSTEIKVGEWNHTTIKGATTFHHFKDYLNENAPAAAEFQTASLHHEQQAPVGHSLTGGEYTGTHQERVHVEKDASSVTFDWISDQKDTDLTLISPNKKTYRSFTVTKDDSEFLNSAYHHLITIHQPDAGKWTIETKANQKEHYLLDTAFESPVNAMLSREIEGNRMKVKSGKKMKVKTDMTIEYYGKNGKWKQRKVKPKKNGNAFEIPNLGEGIYNMTMDIEGSVDGSPLERTIIQSVYVDAHGKIYSP
ncbi:triacylglycerol lipase [Halobacillus karajensis]|uniref:GPI inositol-deacylase PGAP1-like alpha/beta domain-containing protein n=1 Tax=Halobacillus karajensis TaxID=195088 RepID=A0A059NX89_9BACI|nr:hypothetical protein [Halobacillus karajensis]CDQ18538.1 putative protein with an alpha/beta hydrolase fold protein [Halobacillus karajensis]CDQ23390.1 putative protein with an alpha/beta hydrolase fold protein [Halobacillus karajensis]CDQ26872.1 putative protein with an alpha/beta hydrolase fold protein [Halobacillus karajensis]SEH50203.1 triacylglycerol lipase [Halobacillus karajensis]